MTIRSIQWPDERESLIAHLTGVYGPEEADILTVRYYGHAALLNPEDCLVIEGDDPGEIAAHGLLVTRQLQIGASVLPTAEIALVSVLPTYADRGYEHDVLDALHERMDARGDALGLAFGPLHLYERWHYEYAIGLYFTSYESDIASEAALHAGSWDATHSYERRTADRLGVRGQSVNVRRFYLDDLPVINTLYTAASAAGYYMLARDEATWTAQLDHLAQIDRGEPDDFLVAETDGQIVAYLRTVTHAPANLFRTHSGARVSVIESGGTHPDGLDALLNAVGVVAHGLGEDRIGLFVHPDQPLMQHALARGACLRHFTGAGLLRLHNLDLVLNALAPALEERRLNSRFRERAYHLVLTTEHTTGEVVLGMGNPGVVELEIPTTSLVRLITGWYGAEHLAMGYNERYAELLRVLFPLRDPRIGIADLI